MAQTSQKVKFHPFFRKRGATDIFLIFLSDSSFWLFGFPIICQLKTCSKIVFFQFFVRFSFLAASFTIKNIIQNLVEIVFSSFRWHKHLNKWNFTRFFAKEVPQTLFLDLFVRFFFLVVWLSNHFSIKNLFKNRFFPVLCKVLLFSCFFYY